MQLPKLAKQDHMTERRLRENEIHSVVSADGKRVFAIIKRNEGLYAVSEDYLAYYEEDDLEFWLTIVGQSDGLYGSPEEAEREIRARNPGVF